jgi:hypothetical protein
LITFSWLAFEMSRLSSFVLESGVSQWEVVFSVTCAVSFSCVCFAREWKAVDKVLVKIVVSDWICFAQVGWLCGML